MTTWFKTAQECVPGVPLYLNDFSNHDMLADSEHFKNYYRTALFLQKAGAPLGGLGLQGHIGAQPSPPEAVLATLDLYAKLNLPIRVTEFDINTDDEKLQAEYTRDFLILAFSHPAVVGVQFWGFWEKNHWRPQAAMFRNDWSEKRNARVYRELVLKRWRTQVDGQTGANGRYAVRGFHGDYVITVERDGQRVEKPFVLAAGATAPVLQVTLP
jgi:GH35 family endo-1,4-beta-xylanase